MQEHLEKLVKFGGTREKVFFVYNATYAHFAVYHAIGGLTPEYENVGLSTYTTENFKKLIPGDVFTVKQELKEDVGGGYYTDTFIFLNDAEDDDPYTATITHASGVDGEPAALGTFLKDFNKEATSSNTEKFSITEINRISETQAEQISVNILNSGINLYNRLDHDKPTISSVTHNDNGELIIKASDPKIEKYDSTKFPTGIIYAPIQEPSNNGIVGYQVTKTNAEPISNWKSVEKNENLNLTTDAVESNGTYYVWVLDVGGNTNYKEVVVSGVEFDKTPPTLGKPNVRALEDKIEIEIKNATDDSGIKQYEFFLNDKLITTQTENKYTYSNLTDATNYTIKYTVTDNKGNKATSENISVTTLEIKITETYTVTNNYISRIKANTKKQDFLNNINSKVQAKVLTKDGKELEDTKNVGTGMKLDTTKGIFTIIITGDITGDGKISSTDIFRLKRKLVNLESFDTIEDMASDVDYNNNVTSTDLLKTKQVCVGLLEL